MEVFTVRSAVVAATVRRLEGLGMDRVALARDAGFDLGFIADADARVPESSLLALWRAAERRWPEGQLGLHAGRVAPPGTFDVLDYLATAAKTLGAAFERLAAYSAVVPAAPH